jgi:hypothetical protein
MDIVNLPVQLVFCFSIKLDFASCLLIQINFIFYDYNFIGNPFHLLSSPITSKQDRRMDNPVIFVLFLATTWARVITLYQANLNSPKTRMAAVSLFT